MQTIPSIQMENTAGASRRLLEDVQQEAGVTSNMIRTIAQSPRVLQGYLEFNRAIAGGKLNPKVREQIALAVAQANQCEYSLAQHSAQARQLGLTEDEILAGRDGRAADSNTDAVLRFAREVVARSGDASTTELRDMGYSNSDIVEIVAHIALNLFDNYFNLVARTELDFPKVSLEMKAAA